MSLLKTYRNYADNPTGVNALFSDIMGEKPLEIESYLLLTETQNSGRIFQKQVYERNIDLKNTHKNWPYAN
jgi:hypothetical protein